jgi:hypothetical protein
LNLAVAAGILLYSIREKDECTSNNAQKKGSRLTDLRTSF